MKKERKLKLEMNRVSVSRLNNIKGGNPIISVELPCVFSINNFSCVEICQTGLTVANQSEGRDC